MASTSARHRAPRRRRRWRPRAPRRRAPASSSTAAGDFSALRAATTTRAPARASPRAMPSPMPPLPPVTIATLPLRSNTSQPSPCKPYRAPRDPLKVFQRGAVRGSLDAASIWWAARDVAWRLHTSGEASTSTIATADGGYLKWSRASRSFRGSSHTARRRILDVWAIVLTGDAPPTAGRPAPAGGRIAGRRGPIGAPRGPRHTRAPEVLERASRLAPAGQMVTVLTRRRRPPWRSRAIGSAARGDGASSSPSIAGARPRCCCRS